MGGSSEGSWGWPAFINLGLFAHKRACFRINGTEENVYK